MHGFKDFKDQNRKWSYNLESQYSLFEKKSIIDYNFLFEKYILLSILSINKYFLFNKQSTTTNNNFKFGLDQYMSHLEIIFIYYFHIL